MWQVEFYHECIKRFKLQIVQFWRDEPKCKLLQENKITP